MAEVIELDVYLGLPPSPLCERCGHSLCPLCGPFRDLNMHCSVGCKCLDVAEGCDVEPIAFLVWQSELARLNPIGAVMLHTLGPWFPIAVRQQRFESVDVCWCGDDLVEEIGHDNGLWLSCPSARAGEAHVELCIGNVGLLQRR